MVTALRPGAARLTALEDKPRNGSPIRDIQDKLDQALQGAHDPDDGVLALPGVITEQSLSLPAGLTIEQWQAVGFTLRRINAAWRWWVGDWLHYGEQSFGEMASQAMNDLGVDYQQLADCAWVAGRIPVSRRRESLTWSHHREVAALDPVAADALLDQAEEGHWTRAHLREVVKDHDPLKPTPIHQFEPVPVLRPTEQVMLSYAVADLTSQRSREQFEAGWRACLKAHPALDGFV
jgi:hypothetical protein